LNLISIQIYFESFAAYIWKICPLNCSVGVFRYSCCNLDVKRYNRRQGKEQFEAITCNVQVYISSRTFPGDHLSGKILNTVQFQAEYLKGRLRNFT